MDRTVDGSEWIDRGWMRVLEVLYRTDATIEVSMTRVPEAVDASGYTEAESLPDESPLLVSTELTENQAIFELNHLSNQGLVDFVKPFDDFSFVVFRLTDEGFRVAHELSQTRREDRWRADSRQIDLVLTVATGFLAATAVVQTIVSILEVPLSERAWLAGVYLILVFLTVILIQTRRRSRGPDLWG